MRLSKPTSSPDLLPLLILARIEGKGRSEGRSIFFEKKKQKTLFTWSAPPEGRCIPFFVGKVLVRFDGEGTPTVVPAANTSGLALQLVFKSRNALVSWQHVPHDMDLPG